MILTSIRLNYRKYEEADAEYLLELYEDWRWEGIDIDFVTHFLKNVIYKQYEHGGGLLAIFTKEHNAYIGHCGLKYIVEQEEWYLSFRFLKKFWRDNYPLEAIQTCIAWGFNSLNIREIVVDLETKNQGAAKLLLTAGFRFRHGYQFNDRYIMRYSIFSKY